MRWAGGCCCWGQGQEPAAPSRGAAPRDVLVLGFTGAGKSLMVRRLMHYAKTESPSAAIDFDVVPTVRASSLHPSRPPKQRLYIGLHTATRFVSTEAVYPEDGERTSHASMQ